VTSRHQLDFWYDFASTYSYLSAMRIDALAEAAGIAVRWRLFLLGPIFSSQGWKTSPFNLYAAKGRNMWRDLERQTAARGLKFVRPEPFPQNGLLAARVALIGEDEGWAVPFSKAVFETEFAQGEDISQAPVIASLLAELGLDGPSVMARAEAATNKGRLRAQTEEAQRMGIFGAPSFVTADGELFWGDDRLEQALAWAPGT